ncbi:hypothetical protein K456DRAFT_56567 [Colletotrichum gloeosporioides 23]|nr:hypothetical protein K456DRAFT_56567 [Colletotrichum gloeosporioides 23]
MAASVGEAGDCAGLCWAGLDSLQRRARRRFGDVGQRKPQEEENAPAGRPRSRDSRYDEKREGSVGEPVTRGHSRIHHSSTNPPNGV